MPVDSALLVVAVPATDNYNTELEFEYWLDEKAYNIAIEPTAGGLSAGTDAVVIAASAAGGALLLVVCFIVAFCVYRNRQNANKIQILDDGATQLE